MTADEAIDFLEQHQPMPADESISETLIGEFDEARQALERDPDPRGLRLLLGAFGEGSGFGVYQLVDDTLRAYPRDDVVAALRGALTSSVPSVRSWSMEMALDYPDHRLLPAALALLSDVDRDTRYFAASYVADLRPTEGRILDRLREVATREDDEEIRSVLREVTGPVR
jgi:HEAT repeat protein